jgi:hypothetical protein
VLGAVALPINNTDVPLCVAKCSANVRAEASCAVVTHKVSFLFSVFFFFCSNQFKDLVPSAGLKTNALGVRGVAIMAWRASNARDSFIGTVCTNDASWIRITASVVTAQRIVRCAHQRCAFLAAQIVIVWIEKLFKILIEMFCNC